jgi:LysR family hydrogen peroxide-inducible transcriptional activator
MAGRLTVGLIPTIGPYLLPHIVGLIHQEFPKLQLQFKDLTTSSIIEQLGEGRLDLGILALPIQEDGLESFPMYEEPFLCAVSSAHDLSSQSQLPAMALEAEPLLLLEEGHCFGAQALQLCGRYGAQVSSPFRGTSLETLRAMVRQGMGITAVPQLAVNQWKKQNDELCYLSFQDPVPVRQVGILARTGSLRRPLFESLAQLIKTVIKSELPYMARGSEILPI